jgi:hypothetical protein
MNEVHSSTGLFQFKAKPADRLCSDCVLDIIVANEGMRIADWQAATIDNFDAEHCDSCDCVPAAEGKSLKLQV